MWKIIIFAGFLCFVPSIQGLRITGYVCEGRRGILFCPKNTVIQVKYANYGRTSTRYCPHQHIENTNCRAQSTFHDISGLCNMMKVCHVWASHKIFGDPCYGTYKYLETTWECVPIASPLLRSISCEGQRKTISCPSPSVIQIRSAHYGRTSRAICVSKFMGNTRCYALSSFRYISDLCNEKRSCVVFASNSVFGDPCFGTYKYLDVRYKCVRSAFKCSFSPGDGTGGSEEKIGYQTGDVCVQECIARKKKDDSINGVTIYQDERKGCWCEKRMTGIKGSSKYKTCLLQRSTPDSKTG